MSVSLTPFSMELANATPGDFFITVIQVVYGIPSFILMIFFLVYLGCSRRFTYSFYRLVQLDLATNIICYFNTWLALRIGKYPIGISILKTIQNIFPGFLTISAYACRWFMHMQFASAAALSLHRIISAKCPYTSEELINRWYLAYGLLCGALSFLPELLLPGSKYSSDNEYIGFDENGVLTRFRNMIWVNQSVPIIAGFSLAYFIALTFIGIATSYLVSKQLKIATGSSRVIKRKLFHVAVTYTIIYIGILFSSVTSAMNTMYQLFPSLNAFSSVFLTFGSDMMTLALPYILLAFDTNIRKDLFGKPKVTPFLISGTPMS